jgi:hypothetical protein
MTFLKVFYHQKSDFIDFEIDTFLLFLKLIYTIFVIKKVMYLISIWLGMKKVFHFFFETHRDRGHIGV